MVYKTTLTVWLLGVNLLSAEVRLRRHVHSLTDKSCAVEMVLSVYPGDLFLWCCYVFTGIGLLLALMSAPWRPFFSLRERSMLWLGYWIVVSFVWLLRIPVNELMAVHLCGLTAAVFIFGWSLTVLLGALAVLSNQIIAPEPWFSVCSHFVLAVLIPVSCAGMVRYAIDRIPVNNLFVFLLGGGFFGAMIVTIVSALMALALFAVLGAWGLRVVVQDNLWLFAVSMFPEGFMAGAVLTIVTVLWPSLVKTYDEDRYLSR